MQAPVRLLVGFAWVLFLVWAAGSVLLSGLGPESSSELRLALGGVCLAAGVARQVRGSEAAASLLSARGLRRSTSFLVLAGVVLFFIQEPKTDRNWMENESRHARAVVDGDLVRFTDIRNFRYRSPSDWDAGWYDADFKISELVGADFIVEHFADPEFIAHTMVSFRFEGERFLTFSVELHKEVGESYHPIRGLYRQYELYYVVADERDALQLRTSYRPSRVRIHPMAAELERIRAFFLSMVARLEKLAEEPEFYNSVASSCTTNLADHLEEVTDHRVRGDYRVYLPGYSSELVWKLGLLGELSLEEALERDRVGAELIEKARGRDDYSLIIRGEASAD